eukprot:PhM_4_TR8210/c0_g1_i1/m.56803
MAFRRTVCRSGAFRHWTTTPGHCDLCSMPFKDFHFHQANNPHMVLDMLYEHLANPTRGSTRSLPRTWEGPLALYQASSTTHRRLVTAAAAAATTTQGNVASVSATQLFYYFNCTQTLRVQRLYDLLVALRATGRVFHSRGDKTHLERSYRQGHREMKYRVAQVGIALFPTIDLGHLSAFQQEAMCTLNVDEVWQKLSLESFWTEDANGGEDVGRGNNNHKNKKSPPKSQRLTHLAKKTVKFERAAVLRSIIGDMHYALEKIRFPMRPVAPDERVIAIMCDIGITWMCYETALNLYEVRNVTAEEVLRSGVKETKFAMRNNSAAMTDQARHTIFQKWYANVFPKEETQAEES